MADVKNDASLWQRLDKPKISSLNVTVLFYHCVDELYQEMFAKRL